MSELDVLLVCECLYSDLYYEALAHTIKSYTASRTVVVFGYKRRDEDRERKFFALLEPSMHIHQVHAQATGFKLAIVYCRTFLCAPASESSHELCIDLIPMGLHTAAVVHNTYRNTCRTHEAQAMKYHAVSRWRDACQALCRECCSVYAVQSFLN